MSYSQSKALGLLAFAAMAMGGTAQAQQAITGASSDLTKVQIVTSQVNGGPHREGRVGISVPSTGVARAIDFQGLQLILGSDAAGVTTFINTTDAVTDHSGYGRFDFAKVSGQDVYFGEWSQTGSAAAGDHSVYFGGTNATQASNVPTSGSATYQVKGISDYANNGALNGTFQADFGAKTVTGAVQNSAVRVDIGTANIVGSAIQGTGASATNLANNSNLANGGQVKGQFFGANAEALAGIVTFQGQRRYDTAFGGNR